MLEHITQHCLYVVDFFLHYIVWNNNRHHTAEPNHVSFVYFSKVNGHACLGVVRALSSV